MTFLLALAQALDYATARRELEANPLVQRAMDLGLAFGAKVVLCLLVVAIVVIIRDRLHYPGVARFVAVFGIVAGLVGAASNVA